MSSYLVSFLGRTKSQQILIKPIIGLRTDHPLAATGATLSEPSIIHELGVSRQNLTKKERANVTNVDPTCPHKKTEDAERHTTKSEETPKKLMVTWPPGHNGHS